MRRLVTLPLLLALAACADPATVQPRGDGGTTSPPAHSYAPNGAVLTVAYEGGYVPIDHVPFLPLWSLYGDGRVITQGPVPSIYPGPAMPNLRITRVDGATIDSLAKRAREAGVDGQKRDYGDPPVADASTTVIRLSDEQGTVEVKVYALSEATDTGLTAEQAANRKRLKDFVQSLTDGSLGPDDEAYEPTAVAVYAKPWKPDAGEQLEEQVIAWKGADPAQGAEKAAGRCTVVTGATLTAVLPDLGKSNTLTRWTHDGKSWRFGLRPLMPDEPNECL